MPNRIKSVKDFKSKKRLNNERNLTTKMIIFIRNLSQIFTFL